MVGVCVGGGANQVSAPSRIFEDNFKIKKKLYQYENKKSNYF